MVSSLEKALVGSRGEVRIHRGVIARRSLLFDSETVQSVTKEMAYSLGIDGLKELEKISSHFGRFNSTIFSESSKDFDYFGMENEVKIKVRSELELFLAMLSPYVLIRPAAYSLEWLLYQYRVWEWCWKALLMCVLPYHDTRFFPRVVQLIDFDNVGGVSPQIAAFSFLRVTNEHPTPLPKSALVSHVKRFPGLLVIVSDYVRYVEKSVCEFDDESHCAYSVVFSFFSSLAYAALDETIVNSDTHLAVRNQLLYNVIDGICSGVGHVSNANMIVFVRMTQLTKLTEQQLEFVVLKLLRTNNNGDKVMRNAPLLVHLARHQSLVFSKKMCKTLLKISPKTLEHFCDTVAAEKNITELGQALINSIFTFIQLLDVKETQEERDETIASLASLLSRWKYSSILMNSLCGSLVSVIVERNSYSAEKLSLEMKSSASSVLIEVITKKLTECGKNGDTHRRLYALLARCLGTANNNVVVSQVEEVGLPVLFCVYHHDLEVRKSAVGTIKQLLISSKDQCITNEERDTIKQLILSCVYEAGAETAVLTFREVLSLPQCEELFDDHEKVSFCQVLFDGLLRNPDIWVKTLSQLSNATFASSRVLRKATCRNSSEDNELKQLIDFIEMISSMLIVFGSQSDNAVALLLRFSKGLLSMSMGSTFEKTIQSMQNHIKTRREVDKNITFLFLSNFLKDSVIDGGIDFLRQAPKMLPLLKPLSKYVLVSLVAMAHIFHGVVCDDVLIELLLKEMWLFGTNECAISTVRGNAKKVCESLVSSFKLNEYPKLLMLTLESLVNSVKASAVMGTDFVVKDTGYLLTLKSALMALCDFYQMCRGRSTAKVAGQLIKGFLKNQSRFPSYQVSLKFVMMCFLLEYDSNPALNSHPATRRIVDLFDLALVLSQNEEQPTKDLCLISCFLLLLNHQIKNVREIAFELSKQVTIEKEKAQNGQVVITKDSFSRMLQLLELHRADLVVSSGRVCSVVTKLFPQGNDALIRSTFTSGVTMMKWMVEQTGIVPQSSLIFFSWVPIVFEEKSFLVTPLSSLIILLLNEDTPMYNSHKLSPLKDNNIGELLRVIAAILLSTDCWSNARPTKGKQKSRFTNKSIGLWELFEKWSMSPRYAKYLLENLDQSVVSKGDLSFMKTIVKKWVDHLSSDESSQDFEQCFSLNNVLFKVLKKLRLDSSFVSSLLVSNNTQRLRVILEVLQGNCSVIDSHNVVPVLLKQLEWLGTGKEKWIDLVHLTLSVCDTLLATHVAKIKTGQKLSFKKVTFATGSIPVEVLVGLLQKSVIRNIESGDDFIGILPAVMGVLRSLSVVVPHSLLPHLVAIFISVGKMDSDDAYTVHIIQSIVQEVLPLLLSSSAPANKKRSIVNDSSHQNAQQQLNKDELLLSLIDAFPHIPSHRHLTLYGCVLDIVDRADSRQKYTACFIIHIIQKFEGGHIFSIDLFNSRSVQNQYAVLSTLFQHLIKVTQPLISEEANLSTKSPSRRAKKRTASQAVSPCLDNFAFETQEACVKHQLDLMAFIVRATHSTYFRLAPDTCLTVDENSMLSIAPNATHDEHLKMVPHLFQLLEHALTYAEVARTASEKLPVLSKFLRHLSKRVNQCITDMIGNLPLEQHLESLCHMLNNTSQDVCRQAMDHTIELVCSKAHLIRASDNAVKVVASILGRLTTMAENVTEKGFAPHTHECELLQLTMCCMKCVFQKVFSSQTTNSTTMLALNKQENEKNIYHTFERFMKIFMHRNSIPLNAFVTVALAASEMVATLGVAAFSWLFPLIDTLLDLITKECDLERAKSDLKLSLLWFEANTTSLYKLFASLGNFLSSHIDKAISGVVGASARFVAECRIRNDLESYTLFRKYSSHVLEGIANVSPYRVFVPKLMDAMSNLLQPFTIDATNDLITTTYQLDEVVRLLLPLIEAHTPEAEALNCASNSTSLSVLQLYLKLLSPTFLIAHSFRETCFQGEKSNSTGTHVVIDTVGDLDRVCDNISESFSNFALKHSETQCRILIKAFFSWANDHSHHQQYAFYFVLDNLWSKLKSIMLLFVPIYHNQAMSYLTGVVTKGSISVKDLLIARCVLNCLSKNFTYDRSNSYADHEKVVSIMKPLLLLLECLPNICSEQPNSTPFIEEFVERTLAPTIASLVSRIKDNNLYSLIQQKLLQIIKQNTNSERIIVFTLIIVHQFYVSVGSGCPALLPEASPVLMEIAEDDSPSVAKQLKAIASTLESITGESTDRYF